MHRGIEIDMCLIKGAISIFKWTVEKNYVDATTVCYEGDS